MNDDAVREVALKAVAYLQNGPVWKYRETVIDDILSALRQRGMLRKEGTVEVSRESVELAVLAFEIVGFDIEPEWLIELRAAGESA